MLLNRWALFIGFVVLLAATYVRTVDSQTGAVRQLAPGVYSRQGDKDTQQPANTSWVEFRDFVVVIEANTPWGIKAVLPEIRKTTRKPIRYAFDTHYHWDHTQGNSVLYDDGVTVVCSQDCASELGTKGKTEWEQMSTRTGEYSLAPYRLQQPSVVFGDFMAIDDGERRLELRRVGPAHTIGDAVAFLQARFRGRTVGGHLGQYDPRFEIRQVGLEAEMPVKETSRHAHELHFDLALALATKHIECDQLSRLQGARLLQEGRHVVDLRAVDCRDAVAFLQVGA